MSAGHLHWPNLFASLIRLLIGSLSIDAVIDICHMAGPNRWRSAVGASWDFLKRLRDRWPHKLIIKVVQSPNDAR